MGGGVKNKGRTTFGRTRTHGRDSGDTTQRQNTGNKKNTSRSD